jgi:hypothetical protein
MAVAKMHILISEKKKYYKAPGNGSIHTWTPTHVRNTVCSLRTLLAQEVFGDAPVQELCITFPVHKQYHGTNQTHNPYGTTTGVTVDEDLDNME